MSMNLTCSVGGHEVSLWQTPTFITYMCLSINPKTKKPDGGHAGVRRRYILWVESTLNGVWRDQDDLDAQREAVREHTDMIKKLKSPRFSYT